MKIKASVILLLLILVNSKSFAYDNNDKEEGIYLNLSVTEMTLAEQDLIIATLRYEVDSGTAIDVQNKINQTMKKALEVAKKRENIEISTAQYSVYKVYNPNPKGKNDPETWRGSQSIIIKSKSTSEALALSGQLQEMGLIISDMHHEISPEKTEEVRAGLVENAVNKLLFRAKKAADVIGAKEVKIKTINIDGDTQSNPGIFHKSMNSSMVSTETMNEPVSSPGKTNITLIVSASVLLKN